MKRFILILLFSLTSFLLQAQTFGLKVKCQLSDTVSESSGLINLGGHFFTHEDSGGEPNLYEIDTTNGRIIGVFRIKGATNVDWEDVAADDSFVYIGDFGNNAGVRKDLCIYKISISGILNKDTQITAQKILFSYEAQKNFSNKIYQTNFDAEALVAMGDNLYIFSKNWGNFKSYVYRCSKLSGTYSLTVIDSLNALGLITGADYDAIDSQLILCGYTLNNPFILGVKSVKGVFLFNQIKRTDFATLGSVQIEAVCKMSHMRYLISCEKSTTNAQLYIMTINQEQMSREQLINTMEFICYPNPLTNILKVRSVNLTKKLQIYNRSRQIVFVTENVQLKDFEIDLTDLSSGEYYLVVEDIEGLKHLRTIRK